MRVLFVPMPEGGPAHIIPLLALNKKVSSSSIKTAFLLTRPYQELIRQLGVDVLDIAHRNFTDNGFRTELSAYRKFQPDVVIDDSCLSTGYASDFAGIPRLAIQRTGLFPNEKPNNKNHVCSITVMEDVKDLPDVSFLGLQKHQNFSDFFKAKTKIVPGIKSLEVLPAEVEDDPSYHFAGPLLMDDLLIQQFADVQPETLDIDRFRRFETLDEFWERHKHRKIVYMTFGTIAKASSVIFEGMRYLLEKDIAVVSTIKLADLPPEQQELYYFASWMPTHTVCEHINLMIHQCGSGTYHYPIIHNVPSITIGSQCFDREHVAVRLAEYGCSIHLPAPNECDNFFERFREAVDKFFEPAGIFMAEKRQRLTALNDEIEKTSAAFDFEKVLNLAVAG